MTISTYRVNEVGDHLVLDVDDDTARITQATLNGQPFDIIGYAYDTPNSLIGYHFAGLSATHDDHAVYLPALRHLISHGLAARQHPNCNALTPREMEV